MGLSLRGTTSGAIDINAPAVAGDNTITLPGNNGSANQFFKNSGTAGIVTYSSMVETSTGAVWVKSGNFQLGTTSGTDSIIHTANAAGILYRADDNGHRFQTYVGSWQDRLIIKDDGKVGIGTDDPTTALEVKGDITVYNTNNQGDIFFGEHGDVSDSKALIRMDQVNSTNGELQFHTEGSGTLAERLRVLSGGAVVVAGTSAYSDGTHGEAKLQFNTKTGNHIGACSVADSTNSITHVLFKNPNGAIASVGTHGSDFIALTGNTERLRIASDGTSTFTGQRHKFIHNNSGGVGAYLSLFNTNATAGSSTGICFGIGGSDAVLDGTDYGESQIKVYSDSGNYGNMEINLHTGANRSYLKIVGNGQGETGASAGTEGMRGGVAFGNAGIAFDRSWTGQPGILIFNENVEGDTDQSNFRFHGWNKSYASYPGSSGSDFGVSLIADGMTLTSDRRRKTGITTITDALNTVSQMRGVSFTYVNQDLEPQTHMSMDNGKKLGFIAQEVIPLLPELILDSGEKAVELENGYCDRYNMDYGGVTPLLVEAIKELKAKNEVLEARIAALE